MSARFTGGPDDPLLRSDISKKNKKAREAVNDAAATTGVDGPTEVPNAGDCSQHAEEAEKTNGLSKEEEIDSLEKARAKEVRSVLSRFWSSD